MSAEQEISGRQVRITPSTMNPGSTSIDIAGDHWIARGYDLKSLISQIYNVDERRVEIADDGAPDARWDVTLQLSQEVDEDQVQYMLESALETKFRLAVTPQSRSMEVYVLTAPNGAGAQLHRHGGLAKLVSGDAGPEDAGQITYFGKDCSGVSSGGIAASAGTIGEFRRTLEPDLDRLLVDETHLTGSYDFKIGNYANQAELFRLMHDQLGISVTATQRKVTVLTVEPAGDTQELRAAL